MPATMTDNEKKFTESMKEVAADGKTFGDAVKSIVAEIDDVKKIPDAVAAIETLQAERESGNEDVLSRMRRVEQRVNTGGKYRGNFGSEDTARAAGLHVLRETAPTSDQKTRAEDALKSEHKDYYERAQTAGSLEGGGVLVVPEVQTALERAESEHGVAKQRLTRKQMGSDSYTLPVRSGRPKVYLWGEGKTPTESDMNLDKVTLKVQNWATLAFYPKTLNDDSAIGIGEEIIDWFGEGFAYQFDKIAYAGDGSEDDFGKRGVIPKWLQLNKQAVEDVDTNDYANLTEDHFLSMMSKVTNASRANAHWATSAEFFFTVMVPIQLSKGGVTYAEMQGGIQPMFLGRPVDFAEVIDPSAVYKDNADAAHRAPCAFGDLGRAGAWGDRQQLGFASNDNVKWLEGQVAVMGVQRTDVNFFDGVETEEGKSAMSVLKVNPAA